MHGKRQNTIKLSSGIIWREKPYREYCFFRVFWKVTEVWLEVQHLENEKLHTSLSAFFASGPYGKFPCVGLVPCPVGHFTSGTPGLPVHNGR